MKKKILIISSLFIFFISLIIVISKTLIPMYNNAEYEKKLTQKTQEWQEQINNINNKENENNNIEFEVKDVPTNDVERIRMYIGKYISYVNDKDYQGAYDLLDDSFKELNFPTLNDYIQYIEVKYERTKVIEYNKYKIQGFVYVVDTTVKDLGIYKNPTSFAQVFMFKETQPGDYKLSFGI
ncbi:MAG: hypothetical protein PHH22_02485 [Clostridia bacterium]|nr:hypothetical protein [Clostridia bacterium]